MKKTIIIAATITMLSTSISGVAAPKQYQAPIISAAKVKQADLNHDRKVTQEEFLKAYAPAYAALMITRAEKEFKRIDKNKDGVISSRDYH